MTKQGLRDLNVLFPKKKKPRAADEPQGELAAEPTRAPEPPVAEAAAVEPKPL
jgi:hypothetical protein